MQRLIPQIGIVMSSDKDLPRMREAAEFLYTLGIPFEMTALSPYRVPDQVREYGVGAEGSGYVNESYLDGLARQIPGLDFNAWKTARSDPSLAAQVQADAAAGHAAGVSGTPTLIFTGPKGSAAPNNAVPSYSDLQNVIKQVS